MMCKIIIISVNWSDFFCCSRGTFMQEVSVLDYIYIMDRFSNQVFYLHYISLCLSN